MAIFPQRKISNDKKFNRMNGRDIKEVDFSIDCDCVLHLSGGFLEENDGVFFTFP